MLSIVRQGAPVYPELLPIRQVPAPMSHEAAGHVLSDRYAVHSTGAGGLAIFGRRDSVRPQQLPGALLEADCEVDPLGFLALGARHRGPITIPRG